MTGIVCRWCGNPLTIWDPLEPNPCSGLNGCGALNLPPFLTIAEIAEDEAYSSFIADDIAERGE